MWNLRTPSQRKIWIIGIDKTPTPTPTDPIPPPNPSALIPTSDEVEDMDDWLETAQGYKLAAAVKSTQKAIGTPNSHKEALTSKHSEKWKQKEIEKIEEMGCWRLVRRSDLCNKTHTGKMDLFEKVYRPRCSTQKIISAPKLDGKPHG